MTTTRSLLVELFVEELPPKALKKLGESFALVLAAKLKEQGLATDHSAVTPYASPRRLAVHISAVRAFADDKPVSQKLMPVSVGLTPAGEPTPALLKRLLALNADASVVPQLKRQMDGKAEALFFDTVVKGATLAEGLQKALDEAIAKLPVPKLMQYQLADGWSSVHFVRPAHKLVALHGADVVPVASLGLTASRETQGHRFEAQIDPIVLLDADHYARQLEDQGAVIAAFDHRHAELVRQLQHAAKQQGLAPIDDAALLDEVTALVERPNVLLCEFEQEFLQVPQECLILTMKANQKYFPLLDAAGKLTNKFLIVSNIRPEDPSRVIQGNERVVRPRLADAKFFFDQDRKKTLESRVPALDKVVYHGRLGSQGQRVQRVRAIAQGIGQLLGNDAVVAKADRAALLAKTDLLTDMVGEFPELQGVMGGYYARHDGESDDVAIAIEDHYKPRFAGDNVARNETGIVLALADKLETLVGLFGIGQAPTGDKDPFALRRHALGVIAMLVDKNMPLAIDELVGMASRQFGELFADRVKTVQEVVDFIVARYSVLLRDGGRRAQEVDAVLSMGVARLSDIPQRLDAVASFALLPESPSLAAANKRVRNILSKSEEGWGHTVAASSLVQPEEIALYEKLRDIGKSADALFERGDFTQSLQTLAALKTPVDEFFDKVMVNAEDPKIRANRLGLLATLHTAMNRVADLSKLAS